MLTTFQEIEIGANSTVSKLQKWHAPKNKSQVTRQIDTASTNMTQATLLALPVFFMSVPALHINYYIHFYITRIGQGRTDRGRGTLQPFIITEIIQASDRESIDGDHHFPRVLGQGYCLFAVMSTSALLLTGDFLDIKDGVDERVRKASQEHHQWDNCYVRRLFLQRFLLKNVKCF